MTLILYCQMRYQVYFYLETAYNNLIILILFDLVSVIFDNVSEVKNDLVLKLLTKETIIRDIV